MGKEGPCRHCGVTSTPLWRNGPPEKPVLCNACGSRWRTKGSLINYTPHHVRDNFDSEDFKASKAKTICFKSKELKSHKKKQNIGVMKIEHDIPYSGQNFRKIFEGAASNRSSSGSAVSYSESCAHFGTTDASDLTGSAQSNALVPSKKRTCVTRPKPSRVEKLTRDLHYIMHEQQSSYFSVSSEDDLLYESETPMGSAEIGHGGVLIRYIDSKTVEEESEASSLPVDTKSFITNEVYSGSASFPVNSESNGASNTNAGIVKPFTAQMSQAHAKRDTIYHEKTDILRDRDSPLSVTDLKDIANFEVFMKYITHEEQQRLMRYLPSVDAEKPAESLKGMFQSPHFMETLSDFQQLLQEGIFDHSFLGAKDEEGRSLKRLALVDLAKTNWVEYYKNLQDGKHKVIAGAKKAKGTNFLGHTRFTSLKRPRDNQNHHYPESRGAMRSPKRLHNPDNMNLSSVKSSQLSPCDAGSEVILDAHDFVEDEGVCFSPRSIFAVPPDRRSMMVPLQFTDESSDQDLLLDVPCNGLFPEAQLLFHPRSEKTAQNSSLAESGVAEGEESLSNYPYSFHSQKRR